MAAHSTENKKKNSKWGLFNFVHVQSETDKILPKKQKKEQFIAYPAFQVSKVIPCNTKEDGYF